MVEMTPEIKKKLLDLGRDTFDNTGTDITPKELLEKLIKNSSVVLTDIIGERSGPGCIAYTTRYSELISWAIPLICIRYNLYLLQKKKKDGHCRDLTHVPPCSDGEAFHGKLFNEAKKSFEDLIKHDYETEV